MGGQIVDATIVAAPKQRNTDAEKADIKAGKVPDAWKEKPAKLRKGSRCALDSKVFQGQSGRRWKDAAARHRHSCFGYKNHAAIDRRHGFIRGWNVTSASAYDGAQLRKSFAMVLKVPRYLLIPPIMALCVVGAYIFNNRMMDVWVLLAFGIFGLLAEKRGYPMGPLVLGVILGPLAELELRRGLSASGSFAPLVTSPVSLIFLCLAAFVLIWPFYQEWRKKKRLAAAAGTGGPAALERASTDPPPSSSRSSGTGPCWWSGYCPAGGPAIARRDGQRCDSALPVSYSSVAAAPVGQKLRSDPADGPGEMMGDAKQLSILERTSDQLDADAAPQRHVQRGEIEIVE